MTALEAPTTTRDGAAAPGLLDPLRLRGLEVRNRAWVSPMCMYACEAGDGVVGDFHLAHYGQFGLGGAGMVVTEATAVLPEGRVSPDDAGLWSDVHVPAWRRVTDLLHGTGAAVCVQLAHAGRKGSKHRNLPGDTAVPGSVAPADGGWETIGADGLAFGRFAVPRAASPAELAQVVAGFAAAAVRADAAGFDAVELHAAHGYLLHEFLSPVTNTRPGPYGRDERRRLLLETVDAVRAVWPASKPLLVRLSVDDVAPGGLTAAESADLALVLVDRGVDLVDCSSGGLVHGAEYAAAPGYQVPGARTVRQGGRVPVGAVGLLDDPHDADALVRSGDADAVLLGRAMLRDPHWARHAAAALSPSAAVPWTQPRYHRAWSSAGS